MHPDPHDFEVLSFDCYGTLVDWESSMLHYLHPLIERRDIHVVDAFLLEFFASCEPELQQQGGTYREVLHNVLARLGQRLAFVPSRDEIEGFVDSIAGASLFADSADALRRLGRVFELAVLSNTDTDVFQVTARALDTSFSYQVLAGDVGAYKPDPRMFEALRQAVPENKRILHVAQSRFHDIAPATKLGWKTVWIDRAGGQVEAVRLTQARATWRYRSLGEFADAVVRTELSRAVKPAPAPD